jgi:hypothetical protein
LPLPIQSDARACCLWAMNHGPARPVPHSDISISHASLIHALPPELSRSWLGVQENGTLSILRAACVCRDWRDVVTGGAFLFQDITFRTSDDSPRAPAAVRRAIQLAAGGIRSFVVDGILKLSSADLAALHYQDGLLRCAILGSPLITNEVVQHLPSSIQHLELKGCGIEPTELTYRQAHEPRGWVLSHGACSCVVDVIECGLCLSAVVMLNCACTCETGDLPLVRAQPPFTTRLTRPQV